MSGAEFAYENNSKGKHYIHKVRNLTENTEKCFMEIVQEKNIINHYHPNMNLPECLQDSSSPKQFEPHCSLGKTQ